MWCGFPRKKISRDRAHASTVMPGLHGLESILSLHLVVGAVARVSSGMWISALVRETLEHSVSPFLLILIEAGSEKKGLLVDCRYTTHPWRYVGAGIGSLVDEIKAVPPSRIPQVAEAALLRSIVPESKRPSN